MPQITRNWTMVRLGASVQELAQEMYESILGYDGEGGHKPPRDDIAKLKKLHDIWLKKFQNSWDDAGKDAAVEWDELTELTADEQEVYRMYETIERYMGDGFLPKDTDAFKGAVELLSANAADDPLFGDDPLTRWMQRAYGGTDWDLYEAPSYTADEARDLLASALKKKQNKRAPQEYAAIADFLRDWLARAPESYKIWPWAVKQIKSTPNISYGGSHFADIIMEGGKLLHQLRQENRIPQGFDINAFDFQEFEDWLMDWKRENRASDAVGETVYAFPNGWSIQHLTTPEQLQYEGDEMGHCVGGYDEGVGNGEILIYSLRDKKNVPHVTIEMEPAYVWEQISDTHKDIEHMGEIGVLKNLPLVADADERERYDMAGWDQANRDKDWPLYPHQGHVLVPHKHEEQEGRVLKDRKGVPWDKSFDVVQVMGNSNRTPKPEYLAMVKEWFAYLREQGIDVVRGQNYTSPYDDLDDEPRGGRGTWNGQTDDEWHRLDYQDYYKGWWDDYNENPHLYTGKSQDKYGLTVEPNTVGLGRGLSGEMLIPVLLDRMSPEEAAKRVAHHFIIDDFITPKGDIRQPTLLEPVQHAARMLQDVESGKEHGWEFANTEAGHRYIELLSRYITWASENKEEVKQNLHPDMELPGDEWDEQWRAAREPQKPTIDSGFGAFSAVEYTYRPIDRDNDIWFDEDGEQHKRWRPTWRKDPESGLYAQDDEPYDSFLDKEGRQGEGTVAYFGDEPIGSLTWVDGGDKWLLGSAYVHPDHRERGIFNEMSRHLRESGKPVDAVRWENPWLREKVHGWNQ